MHGNFNRKVNECRVRGCTCVHFFYMADGTREKMEVCNDNIHVSFYEFVLDKANINLSSSVYQLNWALPVNVFSNAAAAKQRAISQY